MDTNDYLGSWADENVSFSTQIVKTSVVGQNYWTAMVFVENSRFVDTSGDAWESAPGLSNGTKVLAVSASTYAKYTSGLLQSWLYDLFVNGFTGNCILVACPSDVSVTYNYSEVTPAGTENPSEEGWYVSDGVDGYTLTTDDTVQSGTTYYTRNEGTVDATQFITDMTTAYNVLKPYAYFKTVCAGSDTELNASVALALAKLCATDKGLLSSAPLYPCVSLQPSTDSIYSVISADSQADAFMSYHYDSTHNAALYSLGLALAEYNSSGTPVGNGFDATASQNISPSGQDGTNLGDSAEALIGANVQYFKTVGDNSLSVAAYGAITIKGDVTPATWILSYITYMVKVNVAQLITQRNFLKNASNYATIVTVMANRLKQFQNARLDDISISAPAYADLPDADKDVITIPNAWSATYVDNVRSVVITGTLYIGA